MGIADALGMSATGAETPSHPAQLSNAGVAGLPQALRLHRRLPEEEEDLVIVRVLALRHPEGAHELWLCGGGERRDETGERRQERGDRREERRQERRLLIRHVTRSDLYYGFFAIKPLWQPLKHT